MNVGVRVFKYQDEVITKPGVEKESRWSGQMAPRDSNKLVLEREVSAL